MAYQLVYTSAPTLLQRGRTGFGTVAMHPQIRPGLREEIERFSKFSRVEGLDLERVIYSHRRITVNGECFSVVSRIQDCGADYTGRTNHIAHHIVLTSDETLRLKHLSPCDLIIGLEEDDLWKKHWTGDTVEFDRSQEIAVTTLSPYLGLPASTWEQITGRAALAATLGPGRTAESCWIVYPDIPSSSVVRLLGESMLLHPNPWSVTFSTNLQPTDQPEETAWRAIPGTSPLRSDAERSVRPTLDLVHPEALEPVAAFVTLAETGVAHVTVPTPLARPQPLPGPEGIQMARQTSSLVSVGQPGTLNGPRIQDLRKKQTNKKVKKTASPVIMIAACVVGLGIIGAVAWYVLIYQPEETDKLDLITSINQAVARFPDRSTVAPPQLSQLNSEQLSKINGALIIGNNDRKIFIRKVKELQNSFGEKTPPEVNRWLSQLTDSAEIENKKQSLKELIQAGELDKAEEQAKQINSPTLSNSSESALVENWRKLNQIDENSDSAEAQIDKLSAIIKSLTNVNQKTPLPENTAKTFDGRLANVLSKQMTDQNLANMSNILRSLPDAEKIFPKSSKQLVGKISELETKRIALAAALASSTPKPEVSVPSAKETPVLPFQMLTIEWVDVNQMKHQIPKEGNNFPVFAPLDYSQVIDVLRGTLPDLTPTGNNLDTLKGNGGVYFKDKNQKVYLFDSAILSKKSNASSPEIINISSGIMRPRFDNETKEIVLPAELLVRLSAKINSEPRPITYSLRKNSLQEPIPHSCEINPNKSELRIPADQPTPNDIALQKLNSEITSLEDQIKADWSQAKNTWITSGLEPQQFAWPNELSPLDKQALRSVLETKLGQKIRDLKDIKDNKGKEDRKKNIEALDNQKNQLANDLSDEKTRTDFNEAYNSAFEKQDTRVGAAAVYFFRKHKKMTGDINDKKNTKTKNFSSTAQDLQKYWEDPISNLTVTIELGGVTVLTYTFATEQPR